ncbi:hypothetical protein [Bartonella sp. AP36NXGY]|uniref:hypothetical protein n=1 Tax=Bartonella sp. AP36NXGY TaxID=3243493 RepID=UPI0035D0F382
MGSLFLKDLFYRAGLLGKAGWRGSFAVMWGDGGEWWAQNGLIDFRNAWAPFS